MSDLAYQRIESIVTGDAVVTKDDWREPFGDYGLPEDTVIDVLPDRLPQSYDEYRALLATKVINAGRRQEGHHATLRRAVEDWTRANQDNPDNPGYWCERARDMGPKEYNRGLYIPGEASQEHGEGKLPRRPPISDELLEKAETIIAWGRDQLPREDIVAAEQELVSQVLSQWDQAVEEVAESYHAKEFASNPPFSLNGWVKLTGTNDIVATAYRGTNHGVDVVAATYDTDDGMRAAEFTWQSWKEADGDPQEAKINRHMGITYDDQHGALRDHLLTYDGGQAAEPAE